MIGMRGRPTRTGESIVGEWNSPAEDEKTPQGLARVVAGLTPEGVSHFEPGNFISWLYWLHKDQDLFDPAYDYIRQYY
ncbi:MAG: hypothetical protein L0322_04850 [Chloroflexi bacterium]|nr:hypothetical protein [Chloroflexota bacterium]